jgi:ABC transporter substrate binding protein
MIEGFLAPEHVKTTHAGSMQKRLEAVREGKVAAASLMEPWISVAQKQGLRILIESHLTRSEAAGDDLERSTLAPDPAARRWPWTDGRNLRMEVRWTAGSVDRMRALAKGLVGLRPEMILAASTPVTAALQRETRMIPIVFAPVADPVGSGFVASLPRPGGNITGFSDIEASMGSKWLQLVTEIAPSRDLLTASRSSEGPQLR